MQIDNLLNAEDRSFNELYKRYAKEVSLFLKMTNQIEALSDLRKYKDGVMYFGHLAQILNHLYLAFFSILRRHQNQMHCDLRIAYEAMPYFLFSIENKMDLSISEEKFQNTVYEWMGGYKELIEISDLIKAQKKAISSFFVHQKRWHAHQNLKIKKNMESLDIHCPFLDEISDHIMHSHFVALVQCGFMLLEAFERMGIKNQDKDLFKEFEIFAKSS